MRSQDSVFNLVESLKEKLEWVTPKITLMGAEETEGKSAYSTTERYFLIPGGKIDYAPS